jgi:hypothetical protein
VDPPLLYSYLFVPVKRTRRTNSQTNLRFINGKYADKRSMEKKIIIEYHIHISEVGRSLLSSLWNLISYLEKAGNLKPVAKTRDEKTKLEHFSICVCHLEVVNQQLKKLKTPQKFISFINLYVSSLYKDHVIFYISFKFYQMSPKRRATT